MRDVARDNKCITVGEPDGPMVVVTRMVVLQYRGLSTVAPLKTWEVVTTVPGMLVVGPVSMLLGPVGFTVKV